MDFRDTQNILPQRQIAGLSIDFTGTQGTHSFFGAGIPTMSEWMVLLMALVLLSGSVVMFGSRRSVSPDGMQVTLSARRLIFPAVYWPTLGITVVCLVAGGGALGLFRGASAADYVGGGATALALAYLVHLLVAQSRSRRS